MRRALRLPMLAAALAALVGAGTATAILLGDGEDGTRRWVSPTFRPSATPSADEAVECPEPEPVQFVFYDDEDVGAEDLRHVRQGARLGRSVFDIQNTFCVTSDLSVHVLAQPGPRGNSITAAHSPGTIEVYTENAGWREAPASARLLTMLHEMYHTQQYYLAQIEDPEPAWLVEGSAEWAAATAAAELGVYPSYRAAVAFRRVEADPSALRRAEDGEGWVETDLPYGLALAATETLLDGTDGMSRLDEYWLAIRARNSRPNGTLKRNVDWEAAFREVFGLSVSRFYARLDRVLEREQ